MYRPWQVWLVFTACALGAAAAMSWLTRQAMHSDAERRLAQSDSELQQRASLALWRIDTALAPILAEEIVRPVSAYRPRPGQFDIDQQRQEQQQMQEPLRQSALTARQASSRAATPKPVEPPPYVLLQFEVDSDGHWDSPQVSLYAERNATPYEHESSFAAKRQAMLDELAKSINPAQLLALVPKTSLPAFSAGTTNENLTQVDESPESADEDPFGFFEGNRPNQPMKASTAQPQQAEAIVAAKDGALRKGDLSKSADFALRNERFQKTTAENLFRQQQGMGSGNPSRVAPKSVVSIGVSKPVWIDGRLLLARRVDDTGRTVAQGCWLDWARIKTQMLDEVADILPGADLAPIETEDSNDPGRMLAGLPVRLVIASPLVDDATSPTLRWAMWLGWGALVLAAMAAALLLHGVMRLSERRAAFVSAVTHELRTPLTTFRMYSEMLSRGMVPDAKRRQEYLHTLEREAERLTLLVENVLTYARLERGRRPRATERIAAPALLARLEPHLRKRATEANMELVLDLDTAIEALEVVTDTNVVDQILFNLVDNAAKYARNATDRRIHIATRQCDHRLKITIGDHGPGIAKRPWARSFRAFEKSAEESAITAPGVGLGLALCQRLARQIGGRLEIGDVPGGGAAVSLSLPIA